MTTRFQHAYVLNVLSDDHPGIVAAVSDAVAHFNGNIDAVSQTVLGGYFSLVMIVSFPCLLQPQALAQQVQAAGGRAPDGLQVSARPFVPLSTMQPAPAERFVITAFGQDKPGIIRRLSHYLAGRDINIIDLFWDVKAGEFVMVSQVDIPPACQIALLGADLEEMGQEDGFTVKLQHENVFVATNQLRFAGHRP